MNNTEVKCRYCNKVLSPTEESRECYTNKKCETCEYRCSQCPQRFLRQSSLINHENNHSQPKKKTPIALKSVTKHLSKNTPTIKNSKKISNKNNSTIVEPEAFSCSAVKRGVTNKRKREPSSSSKKKSRQSIDIPFAESNTYEGDIGAHNRKVTKRSPLKPSKMGKEKNLTKEKSPAKSIKTSNEKLRDTRNKITISTSDTQTSTSVSEMNSVNYKPFSCHVCNDNFASENILLEHIQSHGDAAKDFKCKFCGEEFDTIYGIQYHLAVCPLAEDELECTLKNSSPPKFLTKSPKSLNQTSSQGKRGRPKKLRESLMNSEIATVDTTKTTTPVATKRNKRKSVAELSEPSNKISKASFSHLPKRPKLRRSVQESGSMSKVNDDNGFDIARSDVSESEESDDNSSENVDDEFNESCETSVKTKKKQNICPFPRCSMSFTREKALECHMRNHNDDFDDTLKCHKCDIPFDDIKTLRIHVDECQGLREAEDKDDDFSRPKHVRIERPSTKTTSPEKSGGDFLCKTCGRSYHTMDKLKR